MQGSSEGAFLRYFSHQNPEKRTKIKGARLKNACSKEKTHENYGHAFTFSFLKNMIKPFLHRMCLYFRITVELHILDMISLKNRSRLRRLHFNNGISK